MLKGKLAVITGASSGFGEATAHALAKEGMNLAIIARRLDRLEKVKSELESKYKIHVTCIKADMSRAAELQQTLKALPAELHAPDLLINNAGLSRGMDTLWEVTPEVWDEVIDVNVKGLLYVTRFFLPQMLKHKKGHVINVGSTSSHMCYAGGGIYCATKFAVRALTDTLRIELVATPIRVSMISPGMAETEFSEVRFDGDKSKAKDVYKGIKALTAVDIAEAIVFIANRPEHVNIADLILYPKQQAQAGIVHRE